MESRSTHFTEIIGGPGTGKTYLTAAMIRHIVRGGDRAIVVDPSRSNEQYKRYPFIEDLSTLKANFKGIVRTGYSENEKDKLGTFSTLWKRMLAHEITDFNLVLDDTNVFARSTVEKDLQNIIVLARNYSVDIWSTGHSLKSVPFFFGAYITAFGFLRVRSFSNDSSTSKKFDDYDSLLRVMKRVNAKSIKTRNLHYIEFCDQYGDPVNK